jgi:hypothetical protein
MVTYDEVTPEYVNELDEPTQSFLCPLSANGYKIDFTAFKIRSLEDEGGDENILFEIRKEPGEDEGAVQDEEQDDAVRTIRYHFGPGFLEYSTIGTTLEFTVGDRPLHNFRMIERHYFKSVLIKSYDFTLPFVIPNTTNTWEVIYTMPDLSEEEKEELINNPWETRSDSFYFVDGRLVMHNKAEYNYAPM